MSGRIRVKGSEWKDPKGGIQVEGSKRMDPSCIQNTLSLRALGLAAA